MPAYCPNNRLAGVRGTDAACPQCLEPHPTYPFVNLCPAHSRPLVGQY
jgi:hypothetical protein